MKPTAKYAIILALILYAICMSSPANASQQPGHIHLALVALESTTPDISALLAAYPSHYTAGATGPDIGLLAYAVREKLGIEHPGSMPHYHKSGQLIVNMLRRARNDEERAFALGWLTHYWVDCTIHPLVNQFGGYYTGPGAEPGAKDRHVQLEMFEAKHVLHTAVSRYDSRPGVLDFYSIRRSQVPVGLVSDAFFDTYVDGWFSWNRIRLSVPPLVTSLYTGALLMQTATNWFVGQERMTNGWVVNSAVRGLLGAPPTTEEYEKIMDPLQITGVSLVPGDKPKLRVAYQVNDVRLLKAFADEWEAAAPKAVSQILDSFEAYATDPKGFVLVDRNLDTGLAERETYIAGGEFPGNPDIDQLLVTCHVTDQKGIDISPWPSPGEWVPLAALTGKVWGGPAGSGAFEVPLAPGTSGQCRIDVTIEFARSGDKKPYGIGDQWEGMLTVEGGRERQPEPEEEPEREEATGALTSCNNGTFEMSACFVGTVEQKGVGGTGQGEPSWGPREWDPGYYTGYNGRFLPNEKSSHAIEITNATGLEWNGLQFQAIRVYQLHGDTYENWVQGCVSGSIDGVEWVEVGLRRVKPDGEGEWYPYEWSWRAEGIPLEFDDSFPLESRWWMMLDKEDAQDRLTCFKFYAQDRQQGSYGGYTVLTTAAEWPGDKAARANYISVQFALPKN